MCPVASALDDRALGAALAYAVDVKNAVVVAAAGNTGGAGQCPPQRPDANWQTVTVVVSPAWYDDYVLTVGSVNADGMPSAFTLAGPWVDVAATGEAVTSLGSEPVSGTSYAAPLVSGVAALIRARFPALTARQVMRRIESTAHHPPAGWDPPSATAPSMPWPRSAPTPVHRRPPPSQHRHPCRSPHHRHPNRPILMPGTPHCAARQCASLAWWASSHPSGYGVPVTASRATDASCLLSSGPDGRVTNADACATSIPTTTARRAPRWSAAMHRITQLETDLAKWKAGAIAGDVDYEFHRQEKAIKAKIKELRPRTVPAYRPDLLRPENSESGTLKERRTTVRALLDIKLLGHGVVDITPK